MKPGGRGAGALLGATLLMACGEGGGGVAGRDTFAVADSAGVAVAVTPGVVAEASLDWTVADTPDLVLGDSEGGQQEFYRITGLRQVPDGRVAVLDRGSLSVRFFDTDGAWVQSVGREGEGPGEFVAPTLVPAPGADSLTIWDVRLKRLTVVRGESPTDPVIVTPRIWSAAVAPQGLAEDGAALLAPLDAPVMLPVPAGLREETTVYRWVDPERGEVLDVTERTDARIFVYYANGVPHASTIPFAARRSAAVRASEAWITSGVEPQIMIYDRGGRLTRIARIDRASRLVTEEMRTEYVEAHPYVAEIVDDLPRMETVPSFTSLLVDDLGLVWAQGYSWNPEGPQTWTVFEPDGRALGTVETPSGLNVKQIGADFVLGVATTELDVEQVRRYPLVRGGRGTG